MTIKQKEAMVNPKPGNALHALVSNRELPWIMRLNPRLGWLLTLLFGCAGLYVAYMQFGLQSLHGIWVAILALLLYYYSQDYLRLRLAIQKLSAPSAGADITEIRGRLLAEIITHVNSEQASREADLQASMSQRLTTAIKSSEERVGARLSGLESESVNRAELKNSHLKLLSLINYNQVDLYEDFNDASARPKSLRALVRGLSSCFGIYIKKVFEEL